MNLFSNEKQLISILDSLPDPAFILSESGVYLAIFGGTDNRYYHDGSFLIGKKIHEVMDKEKADWFCEQIHIALQSKALHIVEYRLASFDISGLENTEGPKDFIYFEGRIKALPEKFNHERAVLWIASNITERHHLETQLRDLSEKDALTKLYNRRKLFYELEKEFTSHNHSFSLIMFDLDFFKKINDTCGHHVGDNVLKFVADKAQKIIRKDDILARVGGEEFIILMKNTTKQEALVFAERLRQQIETSNLQPLNCPYTLTISLGITEEDYSKGTMQEMIKRVDKALYRAKNMGRNMSIVL